MVWFHRGWVVVAFNLEDNGLVISDIYNTGSFTRALKDLGPCGGKLSEDRFRVFVTAMLRPQYRKKTCLCIIR
jgi:hypothetical protein